MMFKRNFKRKLCTLALIASFVLSITMPAVASNVPEPKGTGRATIDDTQDASCLGDENTTYTVTGGSGLGGAIYISSSGVINGTILPNFVGNSAADGGAIYNDGGTINTISGSIFDSNTATDDGGAIYNESSINTISGSNFIANKTDGAGGAIYNEGSINTISDSNFIANISNANVGIAAGAYFGGAIYNYGSVDTISASNFIGNYACEPENGDGLYGGAIYNIDHITNIQNSYFVKNFICGPCVDGGGIYNHGTIDSISGSTFEGNYATTTINTGTAWGGAICNYGSIGDGTTTGIVDTNFTNNYAETRGEHSWANAYGGAICTATNLLIKARDRDVSFSGNYVLAPNPNSAKGSAIFLGDPDDETVPAVLTLQAEAGRKITFADDQTIEGNVGSTVVIQGAGTVEFSQTKSAWFKNSGVYDLPVTVSDTATLILSGAAQIDAPLTVNSTSPVFFDFAKDGRATDHEFKSINFGADAVGGNLTLDVDLAVNKMDSITTTTSSATNGSAKLHVAALTLLSDTKEDKREIPFTNDSTIKEITDYERDGEELSTHINKYKVNYDKTTGNFIFTKSGVSDTTTAVGDGVNVTNFMWLETVNNLQKRLGDLRGGEESDMAWARFQRSNDDYDGARKFNVSGNLYQVGYDFAFKNQVASRGYFGVSLDAFDGTQSYAIGGGDVKSMSLGAYYTKIYDSGHYFDFILRYGRLENDSTSYDATAGLSGILTKLDYAMNSVTLSGEYGYRANLGKSGLYLEPQAEFIYGYLSGAQATSSTNYVADIDSTNHFVTRLGLAFGQRVKNFNYYLRGSYYHDFAGTIHVKYGGTPYQQDSAQNWWEVSLGGGWNISKVSYFYAELIKHFKDVSNSLNFNVGFRFTL